MTLAAVTEALGRRRFLAASEAELQAALAAALVEGGFDVRREVRLSGRDRIDLLVDRVGIEVKVDGASNAVLRQLGRYAAHPEVSALLLVTTDVRHAHALRAWPVLGGCPVACLHVGGLR